MSDNKEPEFDPFIGGMNFDDYDDAFTDEMDTVLDIEKVKNNIPSYTSEKLCEMIVCDRYIGFNKEAAELCMLELATRRTNGDTFNFEEYIENSQKELPLLNFSMPDLRDILTQIVGKK